METNPIEHHIRLPDGRALAAAECGDPAGRPVVYLHGFPGSRKEAMWIHPRATERGVRLVALDRPGYGGSDPRPRRTLLDWPADLGAAMDALDIDRFVLLAVSGGGPFACACATRLAERVEMMLLVCAMGPSDDPSVLRRMVLPNRIGLEMARRHPSVTGPVFRILAPVLRSRPEAVARHLAARLPERDRAFFGRDECREAFVATLREAFRTGHDGAADDARIYASPWGFEPEEIRVPTRLWHGESDTIVPVEIGRMLASRIPGCTARFLAGEGHFSIVIGYVDSFLRVLQPGPG